jgi:hypothetical protein
MPRPKNPRPPGTTPPPIAPSNTSRLFSARKSGDRAAVTRESIASDLDAFRKAGGKIQVLGVTNTLQRIGIDPGKRRR